MDAAIKSRLLAAQHAARGAGAVLTDFYRRRDVLEIQTKGPNDFVSAADKQAEERILDLLAASFPDDGFIGEETGISGRDASGFQWCIDPLDGTGNFLKGAPNWCVSIGLLQAGRPVAGVIYDPLRDEMFEGGEGFGARCNAQKLHVTTDPDPTHAAIGLGHVSRIPVADFCRDTAPLLQAGFSFRQVGAGALMLAYVAAGRVDLYFERHMWPWDAVAGLALIQAAGGRFRPYVQNGPAEGDMVLAGNPALVRRAGMLLGVH